MAALIGNRQRARAPRSTGVVLGLVGCLAGAGWMGEQAGAQGRKTVWDKIFTAEQAQAGKIEYATTCAGCHGPELTGRDGGGQGPELAGPAFRKKWELQSVNQLYTEIKTRMPRNQPGTLTPEMYLNLVAFILESNKFPAGDNPLVADAALASTFIAETQDAKGPAAAAAITTGSLVQVIGCLENGRDGWTLTQMSDPVRTENPDASSAEQLGKLAGMAPGTATIRLVGVYASLDEHKGHRMEGKGFIVKDPDGDRLNVVSLERVADSCAR